MRNTMGLNPTKLSLFGVTITVKVR